MSVLHVSLSLSFLVSLFLTAFLPPLFSYLLYFPYSGSHCIASRLCISSFPSDQFLSLFFYTLPVFVTVSLPFLCESDLCILSLLCVSTSLCLYPHLSVVSPLLILYTYQLSVFPSRSFVSLYITPVACVSSFLLPFPPCISSICISSLSVSSSFLLSLSFSLSSPFPIFYLLSQCPLSISHHCILLFLLSSCLFLLFSLLS
jgi:hypothetical protein